MGIRLQAGVTFGASLVAIGALMAAAPTHTGAAPTEAGNGDCGYRVEVALTEHLEGVYAPDGSEVQEEIMLDACERLGSDSEAKVWEDGSWMVWNQTGTYWTGCVSTEAPCAD